jgi:hypothetical protein
LTYFGLIATQHALAAKIAAGGPACAVHCADGIAALSWSDQTYRVLARDAKAGNTLQKRGAGRHRREPCGGKRYGGKTLRPARRRHLV